jgi:hypothetical protein
MRASINPGATGSRNMENTGNNTRANGAKNTKRQPPPIAYTAI